MLRKCHIYGWALATYVSPNLVEYEGLTDFTHALVTSNHVAASDVVLQAMNKGISLVDVSIGIVQPAMYEVGRRWQVNQLTVAQEHLATAITQNVLAKAYGQAEFKAPVNRRAMFACIETNHHGLGLRMVSDAFEIEGWGVDYLGANTPTDSLIQMLDNTQVDLLGLSASMHDQVIALGDAIDKLKSELGSKCPPIAIGGLPLNLIPGLAQRFNADTWFPDAKAAAADAR
ncbi:B12-binding domain-containing protein [Pseudomonadota bacterium]